MKKGYTKLLGAIGFFLFMGGFSFAQAQTVLQVLQSHSQTSAYAAAIEQAGLNDRLEQDGSYTVFAPSNSAFNKLTETQKNNSELLLNHVITGTATKRSLQHMSQITCLSGITVEVAQMDDNSLSIQNYSVVESNIKADNGVVHIIEGVIE